MAIANAAGGTILAAPGHPGNGRVDLPLAGNLLLGSVPAILLGGALAGRVPAPPDEVRAGRPRMTRSGRGQASRFSQARSAGERRISRASAASCRCGTVPGPMIG